MEPLNAQWMVMNAAAGDAEAAADGDEDDPVAL